MGSYFRDFYSPKATQRPTVGDTKFSVINQDHMGWLVCDGRGLSTSTYNVLYQVIGYSFGGSGNTFNLPDARGKVPGAIGNPNVNSLNPTTYVLGDVSGNQLHELTITELPAHNHGTDVSGNLVGNGLTGISGEHFHTGITDISGLHTHTNNSYNWDNATSTSIGFASANTSNTASTGLDSSAYEPNLYAATIALTINSDGLHAHTFTTSNAGLHQHSIATQGENVPHNNMQPTIFMGNMFIYSGKYGAGYFPYAANLNIF